MDILNEINLIRRKIMTGITGNLGRSPEDVNFDPIIKAEIKRILIVRPNHRLGNQLLLSPLIREIHDVFPNCKIDLFVKGGLAPILFQNYEELGTIIALPKKHFRELFLYTKSWFYIKQQDYDIVINVEKGSSSGNLATKLASARYKIFGEENNPYSTRGDYEHAAKKPVYNFRNFLSERGINLKKTSIPTLDLRLNASEIERGKKLLDSLVPKEKKTICIFTNATGTKSYSEEWWKAFHQELKAEFKDHNIFELLPVENVSKIDFQEPSFYSKDIREMGAVLVNTDIFIGADCGIMHLASAVKIPTLGLFSVTNADKYQPYGNQSRAINTNEMDFKDIKAVINKTLFPETLPV